jgi:dihydrofolate reductase
LQKAIAICPSAEETFIIGGGEIYTQSIEIADKLDITKVHHSFNADTFFPKIDMNKWRLVFSEFHPKDEKHSFDFTFETYLRK